MKSIDEYNIVSTSFLSGYTFSKERTIYGFVITESAFVAKLAVVLAGVPTESSVTLNIPLPEERKLPVPKRMASEQTAIEQIVELEAITVVDMQSGIPTVDKVP